MVLQHAPQQEGEVKQQAVGPRHLRFEPHHAQDLHRAESKVRWSHDSMHKAPSRTKCSSATSFALASQYNCRRRTGEARTHALVSESAVQSGTQSVGIDVSPVTVVQAVLLVSTTRGTR